MKSVKGFTVTLHRVILDSLLNLRLKEMSYRIVETGSIFRGCAFKMSQIEGDGIGDRLTVRLECLVCLSGLSQNLVI